MNIKPILIIAGEPNSIFLEIFFKSLKKLKIKKSIVLISSLKLLQLQMKKLNYKMNIKLIDHKNLQNYKLTNKCINLINVKFNQNKAFDKISTKSNKFLKNSFGIAFKLLKEKKINGIINGPISKQHFLGKKYLGITEYISDHFSKKNYCMLIFNKKLSVATVTTHLPLKLVTKKINKRIIQNKIELIQEFYKEKLRFKPRIAVLGLNPHCESVLKYNEDKEIISPIIKKLKNKGYKISGPYPADTIFLKNNRKNFDVILGMYHDQVLTPIKTLYEYDAINITLGLPFIRISPDHGPNQRMIGKNLSNPLSLIRAIKFLDKN
tara:strand:+ start:404 stop:1369 length:966 start_codon:yes stop_codon:yes gene_type:complete